MRSTLEGLAPTAEHPLPPQWREYRLVMLTGWTLDEVDAADAARCDWLLLIDAEVREHRAEVEATRLEAMTAGRRN